MALVSATLKSGIQNVFDSYPDTTNEAATGIANAYAAYASTHTFGASVGVIVGKETAYASTILSGMNKNLSSFINALVNGVTTYWTGVAVTGPQTGTTIPPIGAATAIATITAGLGTQGSYPDSTSDAAQIIADALHTHTLTTTATVTPPPGTNLPIL